MTSWWSSLFGSNEATLMPVAEDANQEIAGLNFKTAIEAHLKWKVRLMDVIDGTSTEVINPNIVSHDDQCVLGKWLNGEGERQFKNQPEFQKVVTAHSYFHRCAGHTLALALDGKNQEAATEITSGEFAKASLDVSRHLMHLWRDLGIEKKE
ncbi:MAG: CZB domain-containing protein [Gallionella sp.]|nr:CZB domain-containing protein [Gallionella sp.]